ncbi:unnamed protein product [Arabidopsis arenosa]|uniref:Uncharacterized protein n=1 Tax=Arabidopsis arenosa TaxID=38785 RepID=A0A8S2AI15_ARAAE|nr:unnamed protein product [Arabidopsis arenosa]
MTRTKLINISSYSPISQPPSPVPPAFHVTEAAAGFQASRLATSSSSSLNHSSDSSYGRGGKGKARYEIGESSKRKKGKQTDLHSERHTRQCRKDPGIHFYPVSGQLP